MRDVAKRADLPDVLPRGLYRGVSLRPDGSGFYYAAQDRQTGIRIRYHALGTPPRQDVEVFGSGYGPSQWIGAQVSENGRHLLLTVQHGWARNEVFVQDLAGRRRRPRTIVKDVDAHFRPEFAGDRLIVQTDWKAPRWRIVEVDLDGSRPRALARDRPRGPGHDPGLRARGRQAGRPHPARRDVAAASSTRSTGQRAGRAAAARARAARLRSRGAGATTRCSSTSRRTPRRARRTAPTCGTMKVEPWWRPQVPFDPRRTRRSRSGTPRRTARRCRCSSAHRKGLALDGQRPTLLYGYGGFNVSILPGFSRLRGLVDRAGRRLRRGQPARRRRVRRGVAPGGHAREEAERLRRLHRRRRVADRERLHAARPPRHPRRRATAACWWGPRFTQRPGAVPRRALRLPRPGHARLPPLREQQPAGAARVRQRLDARAVQVPLRLLALPEGEAGHEVPGGASSPPATRTRACRRCRRAR